MDNVSDETIFALAMIQKDIDSGYSKYYIKHTYELTDEMYNDVMNLLNQINNKETQ